MTELEQRIPRNPSTQNYVRRIETQMKKALDGFFEVGRILTEAKSSLSPKAWIEMINNDLPFTRRTAEKFIKIAADPRLSDPSVVQKLPPKWTSLHELTLLDDDQFNEGISTGTIHPDAERKDIKALRAGGKSTTASAKKQIVSQTVQTGGQRQRHAAQYTAQMRGDLDEFVSRELTLAVVRQPNPIENDTLKAFQQEFESLCRKYGLEPEVSTGLQWQELLVSAQRRLKQKHQEMNREAQDNPIQLVEDAFFQLETSTQFSKTASDTFADNDIRNPSNQFYGMDLEQLYGYCLDLQLLTKYTPIEFLDVQSFCDAQIIQVLTGAPRERETALANLQEQSKFFPPATAVLEKLNDDC